MRSSGEIGAKRSEKKVIGHGTGIRKGLLAVSLLATGALVWSWAGPATAQPGPEEAQRAEQRQQERRALEGELDSIKRRLMELQGPGPASPGGPHELGLHPPGPHGPNGPHPDGPHPGGPHPDGLGVDEHRRQAADHLAQAVRHLRAIGADQPANRLENALEGLRRGDLRGPDGPPRGGEPVPAQRGPWGQLAEQGMREVHGKLQALRQTVEKLERRAADTHEVGQAADEAHRKVEKLHRALEMRTEEIERHLDNRTRELEKLLHAHAEKWHHEHEATIEKLRRELDDRFGMVKKHIQSLESEQPKHAGRDQEEAARKKKKELKKRRAEQSEEKEHSAEGDKKDSGDADEAKAEPDDEDGDEDEEKEEAEDEHEGEEEEEDDEEDESEKQ